MKALLEVTDLSVHYARRANLFSRQDKGFIKAVDGVSFTIGQQEIVGLVGESGSGKSTIGHTVLGLIKPKAGRICFKGQDLTASFPQRKYFDGIQMVYQDPSGSLCPTMRVRTILAEPLLINKKMKKSKMQARIEELTDMVDLQPEHLERYPHQLSGGQKQRVAIARAMAMEPELIIADEPTSALDVSVQARLLNLFLSLKEKSGVSFLFISHNLAVVRHLSDRIAVMRNGKIVEQGKTLDIFEKPQQAYTKKLISVIPQIRQERIAG